MRWGSRLLVCLDRVMTALPHHAVSVLRVMAVVGGEEDAGGDGIG